MTSGTLDYSQLYWNLLNERTRLLDKRAELETELSEVNTQLEHVRGALRHLSPLSGLTSEDNNFGDNLSEFGITDAVRHVLRFASDDGLSASEVIKALGDRGFILSKYSSAMAAVHKVLSRLVEDGKDVEKVRSDDGKSPFRYRWIGERDEVPF